MPTLGLDTALGACSAAWLSDGAVRSFAFERMTRGQAEAIAPMVERVRIEAGAPFSVLQRIAVTTGPGTFTGQRAGLAFAHGLALALRIPCVGVTTLEALAASMPDGEQRAVILDARRGEVYMQGFAPDLRPLGPPEVLSHAAARAQLQTLTGALHLCGSGAQIISEGWDLPGLTIHPQHDPDARDVARLGAARDPATAPARPLYLRAPDAKLPQRVIWTGGA